MTNPYITYDTDTTNNEPDPRQEQLVGIRFQNVNIPHFISSFVWSDDGGVEIRLSGPERTRLMRPPVVSAE